MVTMSIEVKGRGLTEYRPPIPDSDYTPRTKYVEGRKGSVYTIVVNNPNYVRKKVVISVDGLNVLTGDATWERGYVLDPRQRMVIPGWRRDSSKVAAFEFSSIKSSYNQQNDAGDVRNIGVIGCLTFDEKVSVPVQMDNQWDHYTPRTAFLACGGHIGSSFTNSLGASAIAQSATVGTGWGEDKTFHTKEVHYNFQDNASETHLIYYDTRQGLERRGIIIREDYPQREPQAFPGYDGCPPPLYSRNGGY